MDNIPGKLGDYKQLPLLPGGPRRRLLKQGNLLAQTRTASQLSRQPGAHG